MQYFIAPSPPTSRYHRSAISSAYNNFGWSMWVHWKQAIIEKGLINDGLLQTDNCRSFTLSSSLSKSVFFVWLHGGGGGGVGEGWGACGVLGVTTELDNPFKP